MKKKTIKKDIIHPKYIYKGDAKITKENAIEWEEKLKGIQHISGYLSIYSNASLNALKSVGGDLSINSNASLNADSLKSVGGDLSIYSNASLNALKSVGGYLSINSKIDEKLEKQLWKHNPKNKWYLSDVCSDWLLGREGNIQYSINNVQFDKTLFDAVRKGTLSAQEVFAITNMEQRRVAYEKMDKIKMRELPNLIVLDKIDDDGHGHPMQLISFTLAGFKQPFKFLNCTDSSTGREYFLECFSSKTCKEAKAKSFGLDLCVTFTEEW